MEYFNHLVFLVEQIAGLAVINQLRHRTTWVGHNRRARSHGFDNDHAERLIPLQWKEKRFGLAHQLDDLAIGQALDVLDPIAVNMRLDLLEKVLLAPRQMTGDMADNEQLLPSLLGNADRLGNALSGRHTADDDEEILRLIVKMDLVHGDAVINDRDRFVS